ncbi:MAG: cob(I)yrinic acid a,c-diamide adenosyltransferase [Candidatus Omnitrophica bacterium]|nr:cob(I)yrinic acid a,c-diamide adenosyltransferase [Candidatus Omnitrophota bacterium]
MIQVYTGNGKGKTTAALGLALRAAGAGKKVYLCQFLKGKYYCELASLKKFKNIKVEQFGTRCFIRKAPTGKDVALARKALASAHKMIKSGKCDMLILDELNVALNLGLVGIKDVLRLIRDARQNIELVITGRNAPPEIVGIADLVSEIKEVKHYFKKGVKARKGIEF